MLEVWAVEIGQPEENPERTIIPAEEPVPSQIPWTIPDPAPAAPEKAPTKEPVPA